MFCCICRMGSLAVSETHSHERKNFTLTFIYIWYGNDCRLYTPAWIGNNLDCVRIFVVVFIFFLFFVCTLRFFFQFQYYTRHRVVAHIVKLCKPCICVRIIHGHITQSVIHLFRQEISCTEEIKVQRMTISWSAHMHNGEMRFYKEQKNVEKKKKQWKIINKWIRVLSALNNALICLSRARLVRCRCMF